MKKTTYWLIVGTILAGCAFFPDPATYKDSGAPVATTGSGKTYYIDSVSGDDTNAGTINAPWKTVDKVNKAGLQPGDSALFKRGSVLRGQLKTASGTQQAWILYGAYAAGSKPLFIGSVKKNAISDWQQESGNIWVCTESFQLDVGNLILNDTAAFGLKKWSQSDLKTQNDYYYDTGTKQLKIFSAANPASLYTNIECSINLDMINISRSGYAVIENLDLRYGGAHGINGASSHHIVIRDCDFSYIGGCALTGLDKVRYGNAIQFWANAHDELVERCRIFEIYDTGVTCQNTGQTIEQYNIYFRYNVIYRCALASCEIWNRPDASITANIYFENNTCAEAGEGWGKQRPDASGGHIVLFYHQARTANLVVRNNIFYKANFATIYDERTSVSFPNLTLDYNCYYNTTNKVVWMDRSKVYTESNFGSFKTDTGKETHSVVADPLFVDAARGDYRLSNASPCIDKGTSVSATVDFSGNATPKGSGTDIGAIEN